MWGCKEEYGLHRVKYVAKFRSLIAIAIIQSLGSREPSLCAAELYYLLDDQATHTVTDENNRSLFLQRSENYYHTIGIQTSLLCLSWISEWSKSCAKLAISPVSRDQNKSALYPKV